MRIALLFLALAGLLPRAVRAAESSEPPPSTWEVGATIGSPSVLNLDIGWWNVAGLPVIARVSGMDYGNTAGFQVDLGWAFSFEDHLKQYVGLSLLAMRSDSAISFYASEFQSGRQNSFLGGGPSYGLNWNGVLLQLGLAFGNITKETRTDSFTTTSTSQLLIQVGYSILW